MPTINPLMPPTLNPLTPTQDPLTIEPSKSPTSDPLESVSKLFFCGIHSQTRLYILFYLPCLYHVTAHIQSDLVNRAFITAVISTFITAKPVANTATSEARRYSSSYSCALLQSYHVKQALKIISTICQS